MRNLGSRRKTLRVVSATTTVAADDSTIAVRNGTTNVTITLPSAALSKNRVVTVKRFTASTGTITIATSGGNVEALAGTFGSTTSLAALGAVGSRVTFHSDGTVWHRIN